MYKIASSKSGANCGSWEWAKGRGHYFLPLEDLQIEGWGGLHLRGTRGVTRTSCFACPQCNGMSWIMVTSKNNPPGALGPLFAFLHAWNG